MSLSPSSFFRVDNGFQPVLRELGLDADGIFGDSRIVPWRTLPDRENCTLDADLLDQTHIRWHIKRYAASRARTSPAEQEISGHEALVAAGLPTATLVGWGRAEDGRSFVIFEDLAGYQPTDKLIESGTPFALMSEPTADLASRLHATGLHHRDLYLCHFMARLISSDGDSARVDLKLIDPARVRSLPRFFGRTRWIVKDIAQFWYSTLRLPVTEEQRRTWIEDYSRRRGLHSADLVSWVERKARSIARHDRNLHRKRPERDVSIPDVVPANVRSPLPPPPASQRHPKEDRP